ncbi:uncharacterized protein LOC110188179 isoform X2 [Drosophila serrata]|uniref:uncharacterized protein LOC110188179 isoform X2 n=1 Tax=Drosophila serrata TaxID=7274 RepID=UPI000A1D0799|nr:uncharacterized protein LOC110188179 isoform X2 [Drosophila serrata]
MLPNSKLKVLFMNVFFILFSAANLNVYHLYADLKSVKVQVDSSTQELWIKEIFIFLIGGLIVVRFLLCFVGVASRVVAILCYLYPESTAVFVIFLSKMLLKIACSIAVLNIYSDQHNRLASFVSFNEESNSLEPDSVDEVVLANHNLF